MIANLASGFAERGFEVDLVLVNTKGELLFDLSPKVHLVDLRASRVLTSLPRLVRYLRKTPSRVLVSALDHANVIAILARYFSRVSTRIVISVHAPLSLSMGNSMELYGGSRIMPHLVRTFYPRADMVVSVSQGITCELRERFGVHLKKSTTINNPIIDSRLYDLGNDTVSYPWFEQQHSPVILAVGRLSQEKDYPTLIRAFNIVREKKAVKLLILGEGPERAKLENMIGELGLIQDVELPGYVNNPIACMKRASCFVLSSLFEGFGNVLVEALAMGCPVVSTDCPTGPTEILEHGQWGSLVPVGDHEAMAGAILTNLQNGNIYDNSRLEDYLQRFHIDEIVTQYIDKIFPGSTGQV